MFTSFLRSSAFLLVSLSASADASKSVSAPVSYVLEPFELSPEAESIALVDDRNTEEFAYQPGNVTFVGAGVTASTDSAFGNGALRVWLQNNREAKQLTWTTREEEAAFNCLGATHMSLWIKAREAALLTLSLFDDSTCTNNCSEADNLAKYSSEAVSLTEQGWLEVKVGLPPDNMRLDHIRGWGISLESAPKNYSGEGYEVLIDHLACVGGGALIGAAFHFDSQEKDALDRAIGSKAWEDEYYLSELSRNLTDAHLQDAMLSMDPYTIEQTESWGGFVGYQHIAPGNSYYNLSQASGLTMDYKVTEISSAPGRAHMRLILYDAANCTSECTDPKNVEVFYSFHYILDELESDSFSVSLQGDDDPSSPLWLPGWMGSAHNKVFDPAVVKGFCIEINMDSQGNLTSLVDGSVSVGSLQAFSHQYIEAIEEGTITVFYVLESFDLPQDVDTEVSLQERTIALAEEYDYSPGNVTFVGSDGLVVKASGESAFGSGALQVWLDATAGQEQLTWVLREEESAFNCRGATYLSLWYKTHAPDVVVTLFLLDDSGCFSNCTELSNLQKFSSKIFPLVGGGWQELTIDLPLGEVRLDHVRGWGFLLESNGNENSTAVLIDHLTCVGGGNLVGAAFVYDAGEKDALERAIGSKAWEDEYYLSELSRNLTDAHLQDAMLSMDPYTIEQTESWGGFVGYKHIAPGNSYYNLSQASELTMDYKVTEISSAPGRAHMRLILYDAANCTSECTDPKNVEVFYSFHYILDELESDSFSVSLQGDDDPSSPLWLPGWMGSAHNKVFDPAVVKGFCIEINMDSQGNLSSLVDGSVSVGRLRASHRISTAEEEEEGVFTVQDSVAVTETDLLFGQDGVAFTRVEFIDL